MTELDDGVWVYSLVYQEKQLSVNEVRKNFNNPYRKYVRTEADIRLLQAAKKDVNKKTKH